MSTIKLTDSELLLLLQKGDESAFRQLFDRYYKYLVVTIIKVSGKETLAHDLTQEVFMEIWKKHDRLKIDNPKSYLRRAVLNRLYNHVKANRLDLVEPETDRSRASSAASVQQELEAEDLQKEIEIALNKLPERCRLIFQMRRLEGLPHKEIAAKLDISTKTIENQLTKAIKILRAHLGPYLDSMPLWLLFFSFV